MNDPGFRCIDATEAKRLIDEEQAIVVDVRTEAEFESGHVPGSYNVPIAFGNPPALVPNRDFVEVMTRHFEPGSKLVFV